MKQVKYNSMYKTLHLFQDLKQKKSWNKNINARRTCFTVPQTSNTNARQFDPFFLVTVKSVISYIAYAMQNTKLYLSPDSNKAESLQIRISTCLTQFTVNHQKIFQICYVRLNYLLINFGILSFSTHCI